MSASRDLVTTRSMTMSDLTDEELEAAVTAHDRLAAVNVSAYVDRAALLQRAALELQRHRAAVAADEERVRSVVNRAFDDAMEAMGERFTVMRHHDLGNAIADRAAKQLATAAVRLSEDDVTALDWLLGRMTDDAMVGRVGGCGGRDFQMLTDARSLVGRLLATGAEP